MTAPLMTIWSANSAATLRFARSFRILPPRDGIFVWFCLLYKEAFPPRELCLGTYRSRPYREDPHGPRWGPEGWQDKNQRHMVL